MSVDNRSLFMFLVFMAILLPLYGCGGGDSGGETGTPPASQPSTHPASQLSSPLASQPSTTGYSEPSGSSPSCSVLSLLTNHTSSRFFFSETGNGYGSYTFCDLISSRLNEDFVLAACNNFDFPMARDLEIGIVGLVLSANTARIIETRTGWDGDNWELSSPSVGTIRLTDGRSRLRIENYRATSSSEIHPLFFDGGCYNLSSGGAILTENADIEETPLSETLSAMDKFLSNYDPDNSDVDEDLDGLDTYLEQLETNDSEIEE